MHVRYRRRCISSRFAVSAIGLHATLLYRSLTDVLASWPLTYATPTASHKHTHSTTCMYLSSYPVRYLQSRQVKRCSSILRRSFAGRRRLRGVIATTLHRLSFPGSYFVERLWRLIRTIVERSDPQNEPLGFLRCDARELAWQKQRKIEKISRASPNTVYGRQLEVRMV